MSASPREVVIIKRDVIASMVPSGARIVLQEGTEVSIVQAKGDAFTVDVFGNLARIEGVDADAIGKTPVDPLAALPQNATLEEKIWTLLKFVYDPEIPVNIVDLGLVYECQVAEKSADNYAVTIKMTLTAPGCGMGPVIADEAKKKIQLLSNVKEVTVDIVFDPPWSQDKMSDAAKLELGVL